MMETVAFLLTGEKTKLQKRSVYDEEEEKFTNSYSSASPVIIYGDTDSLIGETEVKTNYGTLSMEALFHACPLKTVRANDKQFGEGLVGLKTLSLSGNTAKYMNVAAVYRHKVSKARWKVTLEDGKTVEVTNDHSIMVERNGKLIEVKASEILESDDFISIMHKPISNDIR
jgi:hypothetical protein